MADPAQPAHPPGESPNHDVQSPSKPAPDASGNSADGASQDPSSSMPPVDPALSAHTSLPPLDPALPSIDTTIPSAESSLPAIDTSLPPIDKTLPATEEARPTGTDAEVSKAASAGSGATGATAPTSSYASPEQTASDNWVAPAQGTNGVYHQSQQPPQQQHAPPQQQPPQAHFQQQNHGMVHNAQAGAPQMNAGSVQTGGQIQGQQIPQAHTGPSVATSMPPMGQYMGGYSSNMQQMGPNTNAPMHYQMHGDANSILSAQRHKKEVKRRTKTGCLTCRKRRIKCDEGHPVCRNCVKSKRECLGYDPVFRPPPTPSTIQPAPNPSPSLVVNPQDPSYSSAPPGYAPATSQPIPTSHHSESPTASIDHGTAVDPALEGSSASNMAGVQDTEGTLQSALNPSATQNNSGPEHSAFRLKQVRISDLLALKDVAPPPHHPIAPLSQRRLDEVQAVFVATYGQGLDKLLETKWYEEKALTHLMADAQLMAEYSALIDAYNAPNLSDPNVIARVESFEASVIWSTMTMCRRVSGVSNGNHGQDYDLMVAQSRLNVIEALITGEHLETNPLAQFPPRQTPSNPPTLPDQFEERSLEFWRTIGHFLTLHDNEASSAREIDDTLGRTRTLLDTLENRDVIYSVAIARHVGQRWADFPHSIPQPITTNERDAGAKLYVAQKFLEQEASVNGTTQVMKRICGMVVRSWYIARE